MKKVLFVLCSIIATVLLLCACSTAERNADKQCTVILSESPNYTCSDNIKTVARGSNAAFTLCLDNGYKFADASYSDYAADVSPVNDNGQTTVALTLKNVKYSVFVDVELIEVAKTYKVNIDPSDYFRCDDRAQSVTAGQSAVFTLMFNGEYTLDTVDILSTENSGYHVTGIDSSLDSNNERRVVLTVENIQSDTAVTVKEKKVAAIEGNITLQPITGQAVIGYVLNGGRYVDEDSDGSYFTRNYTLSHFSRPNTSIGTDTICRDGYVQIGWNTEQDGSGEHIGLGSRADVYKGGTLLLYAEWAEWTDPAQFDYVVIDERNVSALYKEKKDKLGKLEEFAEKPTSNSRCAVITAYRGTNDRVLVIPETLDGYPVAVIASRTLIGDERVETLVLPSSIKYVMETSFIECKKLTEVYLFDNLQNIDYNAFGSNNIIEKLYINAKLPPIYGKNESAQLANKIEMLVTHGDTQKTIIFGSCSIWYSINAAMFGAATGRTAYNMGVEGDTCVLAQLDLIRQYMHEGDELIYLCDIGSPYLLGYDVSFDARSFRMFEANYDLLATLELQRYTSVISALSEYLMTKHIAFSMGESGSYDDYLDYMTDHGDMGKLCEGNDNDGLYPIPKASTLIANNVFEKTKVILKDFADIGVDVYYGFGLISEECFYTVSNGKADIEELNDLFIEQLSAAGIPAKRVGTLLDAVLPPELFYDMTYRLTTSGARYYTGQFVDFFKEVAQ